MLVLIKYVLVLNGNFIYSNSIILYIYSVNIRKLFGMKLGDKGHTYHKITK